MEFASQSKAESHDRRLSKTERDRDRQWPHDYASGCHANSTLCHERGTHRPTNTRENKSTPQCTSSLGQTGYYGEGLKNRKCEKHTRLQLTHRSTRVEHLTQTPALYAYTFYKGYKLMNDPDNKTVRLNNYAAPKNLSMAKMNRTCRAYVYRGEKGNVQNTTKPCVR